MELRSHILSHRWTLNIPVKDADNAREISEKVSSPVIASIVLKDYADLPAAVREVRNMLSLGGLFTSLALGDGDPRQWSRVVEVARETHPHHVNQLYPTAGYAVGALRASGAGHTVVNALIEPTGRPGWVCISTGPFSADGEKAVVPAGTAVRLLKDAGIESVKFYPMHGLKALDEFCAVVNLASEEGIVLIEPSGGIDASNVSEIVKAGLRAGKGKVHIAPHVYGAVRSKEDKSTVVGRVLEIQRVVEEDVGDRSR
jgi:2-dehydro-3-deoxy-phosphogluconate aldolase